MSQQNVSIQDEDKQHLSCTSWENHFFSSFNEMDEDLAKNIDTDGFCGGSVAVTLIKQVTCLCPLRVSDFCSLFIFFLVLYCL